MSLDSKEDVQGEAIASSTDDRAFSFIDEDVFKSELSEKEIRLASSPLDADPEEGSEPESNQDDSPAANEPELPSGDDDDQLSDIGDEPSEGEAKADGDKSWYSQSDIELANSYGLESDDLADFKDQADFLKVAKILEKRQKSFTQEPAAKSPPAAQADPATPAAQATPAQSAKFAPIPGMPAEAFDENGKILVDYFKENYFGENDAGLAMVAALRTEQDRTETISKQFDEIKKRTDWLVDEHVAREEEFHTNLFHRALDSINTEFFGKVIDKTGSPAEIPKDLAERRQKVLEECAAITRSIAAQQEREGKPIKVPSWEVLAFRATQNVFGKELSDLEKKAQNERIAVQSRKRRQVGTVAGAQRRKSSMYERGSSEAISNDPNVMEAWRALQESS